MGSNALLKTVATGGLPVFLNSNPFLTGRPIRALSTGAGVLWGANRIHRDNEDYVRYDVVSGWGQALTETDIPALADAYIEPDAAIDPDEICSVVALVNGNPITRVAKGATPGAGEFKVWDDGGVTTVTFGTDYGVGTKVELHLIGSAASSDKGTTNVTGTLTANTPKEVISYDFVVAATAAVILEGFGGGGF